MKFSILLPTRNRLELLKLAVESVRQQDCDDWEIVISDNASSEEACTYIETLREPRIHCHRTEQFLPVTENWNTALERSAGDYLIMLGDDDGLMLGCLSKAKTLIDEWDYPEAIYTEACQYAYPGVIPGHAEGFIQFGYNDFLQGAKQPFRLSRQKALDMAFASMEFRIRFGFNMQHFIFSRKLVEALRPKGPFFQSPYPDYYAANAIMLAAASIVVNPTPLVMIGISPKSFGYYYFNNQESDGVAFLQNAVDETMREKLRDTLVPGSNMNDSWLYAMETLARNFRDDMPLRVDYGRYRLLQFHTCLRVRSWRGLPVVLKHMHAHEFFNYGKLVGLYIVAYLLPSSWRRRVHESIRAPMRIFPHFDPHLRTVPERDILEAIRHYRA